MEPKTKKQAAVLALLLASLAGGGYVATRRGAEVIAEKCGGDVAKIESLLAGDGKRTKLTLAEAVDAAGKLCDPNAAVARDEVSLKLNP